MTSSQLYHEDRIVYTSEGDAMGRYEFQRWAEPAPEMIDDVLLRQLDESGRFQHISMLRSNARGDYLLRGRFVRLSRGGRKTIGCSRSFRIRVAGHKDRRYGVDPQVCA
jgi:ABC-type uncharacterized transport system auxiliary subunit